MRYMLVVAVVLLLAPLTGCSRDPEKLKIEYLASGDRFGSEKKYPEAIIQYKNAIALDPRLGEARFKLANMLEATGDFGGAFREYVRAADVMPKNARAQLLVGQYLLLGKQYPEAKARAAAVLVNDPKNVDALILMGNAMANLKDFEGAISQLEEAIAGDPQRTLTYANLGMIQFAKGDTASAEGAFKRAVNVQPRSVSARLALANYYWAASRKSEAEGELKAALAIEPHSPLALQGLAAFYLSGGRTADAEVYLKEWATASSDVGPKLILADFYLRSGRNDEARPILEKIAKEKAGYAPAMTRLGALDYSSGRQQQAHAAVDAVLRQEPQNENALLVKARFLMVEKKPADALVLANKAINANPLSIPAQILKATALEQSGAVTEAVAALRDLLAHAPTVVEAQLQLAAIYITQRDMQGAADLAGQAVTIRPQSGLAHLLFARASLGTGNLARAESELRALAATNPQSAEIHTLLGELYVQKRDVAHARESFDKALKLQPASVEALGGMVTVLLAEKKLDAARTIIVAQLKTSPDDPNLLALAGATFQTTGDMQRAEEVFRKAVQLDPANFDAYRSLGNLYMTQHRLEEAKKEYELAASRRPEAAVGARTMVGLILEMQGKRDEARKQYEKVLELNPRAAVAANNLAWEHAEAGENLDVALQLAQTAKAQMPNNGMVSDTLGWVYYKKGLASLAVTALKDGVTQDRSNPLLHYHLGLAYAKNGNREEARRSLEQALKLDPRFAGAEDAKRVLVTLKG